MFVQARGGNRGGKDQFTWDIVKADKYKEFYLGHSLHTARPTFNNPRPNTLWYTKQQDAGKNQQDLSEVKEQERILMLEALGKAPRVHSNIKKPLEKQDFDALTKRGATDRNFDNGERVEGLGYRPAYQHDVSAASEDSANREDKWIEKEAAEAQEKESGENSKAEKEITYKLRDSVTEDVPRKKHDRKDKKRKKEKKDKKHKKSKKEHKHVHDKKRSKVEDKV